MTVYNLLISLWQNCLGTKHLKGVKNKFFYEFLCKQYEKSIAISMWYVMGKAKSTYFCQSIYPFWNWFSSQLVTYILAEMIAVLGN